MEHNGKVTVGPLLKIYCQLLDGIAFGEGERKEGYWPDPSTLTTSYLSWPGHGSQGAKGFFEKVNCYE
jgi:hypothetical protein